MWVYKADLQTFENCVIYLVLAEFTFMKEKVGRHTIMFIRF